MRERDDNDRPAFEINGSGIVITLQKSMLPYFINVCTQSIDRNVTSLGYVVASIYVTKRIPHHNFNRCFSVCGTWQKEKPVDSLTLILGESILNNVGIACTSSSNKAIVKLGYELITESKLLLSRKEQDDNEDEDGNEDESYAPSHYS